MDNRLIFLYPHICEVMTEKANLSRRMEEAAQAEQQVHRQIRAQNARRDVERMGNLVVK